MSFTIKPIQQKRRRGRVFRFPKIKIRKMIGPVFTIGLFLFFAGVISLAALTAWVRRDLPNPNTLLDRTVAQSTKIYDRTGEHLLYDIHGTERRTLVKLEDLPKYVVNSTIALEDKNFYQHKGFVITSIFRSVLANVFLGRKAQGGSTLTQQFIKNAVLTSEKTYARKIKEIILSIEIERRFSKEEILQLYFNEIPYGRTNYGIEAASQSYFKKTATTLTLTEAATLASITQAPTTYLNNPDKLKDRRNLTLSLMAEQGYITKQESERAQAEPLTVEPRRENIEAAHFVLWVKETLTEKYGEREVEQGGLKVITTIDYEKQKSAEKAVADNIKTIEDYGGSNASLVAIDPKTGQILSWVGSRDYFDTEHDGAVNIPLMNRQPGSSFKPVVYSAGFAAGYTPTTVLYDVVTTFKNYPEDYTPYNYNLKEYGPVTVRQALQGSLNIPAVKMLYLVGVDKVLDFAENLGYTTFTDRSRFGLALVLGGGEVKLLEHVSAYGTFANDGVRNPPVSVLRVEDARGQVLEEWKTRERKPTMDVEVARTITDVLQDNQARSFIFGASNRLTLPDRPVAAKTGTTNDYHDAWTLGYVNSLVSGVWVGNNNNEAMSRGADGSLVAAIIWNQFMRDALKETPPESFTPPEPIITGVPVLDGQIANQVKIKIDRASGLLATDLTPPNWIIEKTFQTHHSILHYIKKEDPRGGPPDDPATDPQYQNWEEAIAKWANKLGVATGKVPPTMPDNLHTTGNRPTLTVSSPANNSDVSYTIPISLEASAPRGIRRITYVVDGALVEEKTSNFNDPINIPSVMSSGRHTLTITAYDDIDNSQMVNISVNIN